MALIPGVLGERMRKNFSKIPLEVRNEIEEFYIDDSNSMTCSGVKEHIKVQNPGEPKIEVQKRLILYNLKDLYEKWIYETSQTNIPCLAFFASLQPPQCIFAGKPGTHHVCVCALHQNFKLKLSAVRPDLYYKDLLAFAVCSVDNRDCMLNNCPNCSNRARVRNFLINNSNIETNGAKIVKYMQWSKESSDVENATQRISLKEISEPLNDTLESLINDLLVSTTNVPSMTKHHFIAYKQSDFYSFTRKNIEKDTGIITMDFAENYPFVAQNSVQAYSSGQKFKPPPDCVFSPFDF